MCAPSISCAHAHMHAQTLTCPMPSTHCPCTALYCHALRCTALYCNRLMHACIFNIYLPMRPCRLKLIPRIVNVDEWVAKGPLSHGEHKLLVTYNDKPILTRPQVCWKAGISGTQVLENKKHANRVYIRGDVAVLILHNAVELAVCVGRQVCVEGQVTEDRCWKIKF